MFEVKRKKSTDHSSIPMSAFESATQSRSSWLAAGARLTPFRLLAWLLLGCVLLYLLLPDAVSTTGLPSPLALACSPHPSKPPVQYAMPLSY